MFKIVSLSPKIREKIRGIYCFTFLELGIGEFHFMKGKKEEIDFYGLVEKLKKQKKEIELVFYNNKAS